MSFASAEDSLFGYEADATLLWMAYRSKWTLFVVSLNSKVLP